MPLYDITTAEQREAIYSRFLVSVSTDATAPHLKALNEKLSQLLAEVSSNVLEINHQYLYYNALLDTVKRQRKRQIKETPEEWKLAAEKQKLIIETAADDDLHANEQEAYSGLMFWSGVLKHLERVSDRADSIGKSLGLDMKLSRG